MDGATLGSIIVAVITTIGTIYAAYLAARSGKLGRLGKVEDVAVLKDRLALAEQKEALWRDKAADAVAELAAEVTAHAATRERAEFAERLSDACERRLNAVYAELASAGRVVSRRDTERSDDDPA